MRSFIIATAACCMALGACAAPKGSAKAPQTRTGGSPPRIVVPAPKVECEVGNLKDRPSGFGVMDVPSWTRILNPKYKPKHKPGGPAPFMFIRHESSDSGIVLFAAVDETRILTTRLLLKVARDFRERGFAVKPDVAELKGTSCTEIMAIQAIEAGSPEKVHIAAIIRDSAYPGMFFFAIGNVSAASKERRDRIGAEMLVLLKSLRFR